MTETRELGRDVYEDISAALNAAFTLIGQAMSNINPPGTRLTAEWHELHNMLQLAGVGLEMAERARDRAADLDTPAL
jgi:hypothetical protein